MAGIISGNMLHRKRHYDAGQLQFITASTYQRAPRFLSERFRGSFVRTLVQGQLVLALFLYVWARWTRYVPVMCYVLASITLLLLMGVGAIGITVERFLRYKVARYRWRGLRQQVAKALRDRQLDQAIAITARKKRNPIARVVASGLASFQAALPLVADADAIGIARRALQRSASLVQRELKRGLGFLGSTAASAPLIGVFGTVMGIIDAFKGYTGSKSVWMAVIAKTLCVALLPTALSLLVAVPTTWCYQYLSRKLEVLEIEMETESRKLVNDLIRYLGQQE